MATLSANEKEIARLRLERETPESGSTIWESTEYSINAKKILRKYTVRFKPNSFDSNGRLHSYGWKVAPVSKDLTPEHMIAVLLKRGFVRVEGGK